MKRKVQLLIVLLLALSLAACATVNVPITPNRVYYESQQAFYNAWDTYHKAWALLPDTDPRKAQWVEEYHPIFLEAALLLSEWGQNYDDVVKKSEVDIILDKLENILLQLAIKKGES